MQYELAREGGIEERPGRKQNVQKKWLGRKGGER